MTKIDLNIYFDFRSPFAYFLSKQIEEFESDPKIKLIWHPISINVLLNLQGNREPKAPWQDTLCPTKRDYLMVDVF